jgi:hypothetical protein
VLGHLYRYPHPYDATKFIYCGQGISRDYFHRIGRTSFGSRFKKKFPGIELPQPIREQVEVENHLELNELETIWMFQYHTWRGYEGGMNLTFPGSVDYKTLGKIGGLIGGPIGGCIQGRRNVESGQIASIRGIGGLIGGLIAGRIAAEKGQIQAVGYLGGRISGRKSVENGRLAQLREKNSEEGVFLAVGRKHAENKTGVCGISKERLREQGLKCGRKHIESGHAFRLPHLRWHVSKGVRSDSCKFCQEEKAA